MRMLSVVINEKTSGLFSAAAVIAVNFKNLIFWLFLQFSPRIFGYGQLSFSQFLKCKLSLRILDLRHWEEKSPFPAQLTVIKR